MKMKRMIFTENQAAEYLQLSPRTLQAWRLRGGGPVFVRVSKRCVRYRLVDLQAWAEARLARSTSEPWAECRVNCGAADRGLDGRFERGPAPADGYSKRVPFSRRRGGWGSLEGEGEVFFMIPFKSHAHPHSPNFEKGFLPGPGIFLRVDGESGRSFSAHESS